MVLDLTGQLYRFFFKRVGSSSPLMSIFLVKGIITVLLGLMDKLFYLTTAELCLDLCSQNLRHSLKEFSIVYDYNIYISYYVMLIIIKLPQLIHNQDPQQRQKHISRSCRCPLVFSQLVVMCF
jgi:hypothetical protein